MSPKARKVAFGIGLPHYGRHASPEAIARVATEAERLGFDSLWVQDRLLRPTNPKDQYGGGPWPESHATVYDPIEALIYAASKTKRIKLGTSVIDALFYAPVILGRRFATLDRLSGGRVLAGLGQGWSRDEFETSNVPIKRRGRGFEEFVAALRAIWGPDPVSFSGEFYRIPESRIGPKPVQAGGPPLILGAYASQAVERAAKIADGVMPVVGTWTKLKGLRQMINLFRDTARAAGRNPNKMHVVLRINAVISEKPVKEPRPLLAGSVQQVAGDLSDFAEIGANHMFVDMNAFEVPVVTQLRVLGRLLSKLD
jgi:probable F420-dependent oxidoreductase